MAKSRRKMKYRVKPEFMGKVRLEDGDSSIILDATVSQADLGLMAQDEHLQGFVEPVPEVAPVVAPGANQTEK